MEADHPRNGVTFACRFTCCSPAGERPAPRTAVRRCRARWTVEEFFRVLKTGLRAEDRRFDHVDDLRKWGC